MRENDIIISNINKREYSVNYNIRNPVNKSLDDLIKKNMERNYRRGMKSSNSYNDEKSKKNNDDDDTNVLGITVIARATNSRYLQNILRNYSRQTHLSKELIIGISDNNLDTKSWKKRVREYDNVKIYQINKNTSLVKCYKFCMDKAKYKHIMPLKENLSYRPNYLATIFHKYQTSGDNIESNRKAFKSSNVKMPGLTVITSTIRSNYMDNVFGNYGRQNYDKKEYILVLNKNSMDINKWKKKAKEYSNIRVYQLDEKLTFGECYNFCVEQAKYDYIVPIDDDDYYASNYLLDTACAFLNSGADVVGKSGRFVYFEDEDILAMNDVLLENCYVNHIHGPTLSFNKKLFDQMKFSTSVGIDSIFCKKCVSKGIKLYSTHKYNHAYIRRSHSQSHTWKVSIDQFLGWCEVLIKTNNYKKYICK